jgi:DNA polymerase-3 subunit epsilon
MSIILLDCETTGTDVHKDQIVEICIQFGLSGESKVRRIKPTIAIPAEASKVHGITAADVADCPAFSKVARSIAEIIDGADVIVGYNVAFDLDILGAEMERAGLPRPNLDAKKVVDVLRLWHHLEPRTLAAAHEKFCGSVLDGAHAANEDVAATGRVLVGMVGGDPTNWNWSELAEKANPFEKRAAWIGPSHHIQWTDAGPAIMFGKHRGTLLEKVDSGFLHWVIGKDFPAHVKEICEVALNGNLAAISERFPRKEATG